ncbi:hypothetical protein [Amaricoccus sp.]|uniref:hypothetical protein n=1 Tax=Amaricoccus sp. TaxID=1872485 RepID=UPI00262320FD|nr:hypothetical protein [uncultured Amaricoccus sp.]
MSCGKHGVRGVGLLAPEEAERAWFAGLLWKAFPEARSENELADLAAEVLSSARRSVHPRTVRNWLRCENSPHFRYVLQVIAMAGAESVFQIIGPEEARPGGPATNRDPERRS